MKKINRLIILLLLTACTFSCGKKDTTYSRFAPPSWKVDNTGKYPVSMTAVVQLPPVLQSSMRSPDQLAAFVNNECRGLGVVVKQANSSVYYVLIHGTSSELGKINFNYYSTQTTYMYTTSSFLDFTVDGNFGTIDDPQTLDLQPIK